MTATLPRLVSGLPNAEYHAHEAVSASGIKEMLRSPRHYQAYRDGERSKTTEALALGRLVHTVVLEPDRAQAEYYIYDGDRRGKDWEAVRDAHPGQTRIKSDQWTDALRIREAVWAHPEARAALSAGGRAEESVFWQDLETGVECRCRPDWLTSSCALWDLKTARDASLTRFARAAGDLHYHVAAAHYACGLAALLGLDPACFPMRFIVVETDAPFAVSVFEFEPAAIVRGHALRQRALAEWARHLSSGAAVAPGYPTGVRELVLPRWHMTDTTADLVEEGPTEEDSDNE